MRWRTTTPSAAVIAKRKRAVVARALAGGDDPLEVLLDNMRWFYRKAIQRERLAGDTVSSEDLAAMMRFREGAQVAAVAVAPYLHSRLAPKIPKGESGLVVNFVIEDA